MRFVQSFRQLNFGWRVALLWSVSAVINLALYSPDLQAQIRLQVANLWPELTSGETAYIAFVIRDLLIGFCLLGLVFAVIWFERPNSIRQFFKLGPIDWPALGLIAILSILLIALEGAFLRRLIYEPIRQFLVSLGLPGDPSLEIGFTPDPHLAALNLVLVLLIFWIEAPEEIFFRGYVQNHLQDRVGLNWAWLLGALIWATWHLFALAEIVRLLIFGLVLGGVFRLRQNTTALAIWHPVGNRILLLFTILAAVVGRT